MRPNAGGTESSRAVPTLPTEQNPPSNNEITNPKDVEHLKEDQ